MSLEWGCRYVNLKIRLFPFCSKHPSISLLLIINLVLSIHPPPPNPVPQETEKTESNFE